VTTSGDPMPEQLHAAEPAATTAGARLARRPTVRIGAVVALALAAGFVAWLVLRDSSSPKATPTAAAAPASAASVAQLTELARTLGHPIFWVGPKTGYTYELTQTGTGKVYIRYLPAGVEVGSDKPYLTVATYPFPGALAALQKQSKAKGAVAVRLPRGGLAVLDNGYPESTHVAYPGVDYQVEVFDPSPAAAMQTVAAGHLAALGGLQSTRPDTGSKPIALSEQTLRAVAVKLGHPVYWAGPRAGYSYELTTASNGNVYIRYLPPGVRAGAIAGYLTVATYPFPGALAAIRRQTKGHAADTIELAGGGLALVDHAYPKSIHLSYPRSDYQVEVFDPSPARVRQIVGSGRIAAIS
jgi:hypothetical protein